jgi:hypothetical protein
MPRKKSSPIWTVIGLIILCGGLSRMGLVGWLILAFFAAVIVVYLVKTNSDRKKRLRAITTSNIDNMTGQQFEAPTPCFGVKGYIHD